jgi:hypothetical protein
MPPRSEIQVVRLAAPDLARQAAALLQLLGRCSPQTTEALGAGIPRASATCEPDCVDQAAATACDDIPSRGGNIDDSV